MGSTPVQYLLQCRLKLAKQLLVSTTLSIKQIAFEVGFQQSSYFASIPAFPRSNFAS
ncbi:helix-turn-helix domain-containing protein [Paenibacillus roseipurpureus]|uniref:Helix-turn-helix domain-containing protein n=1 Tax=Paenibacillus roseopurpureus TaxID=2918901 RepID=A0AA96LJ72_9BACL|nr:helix-turn-helix domain-containing protein [Paenibacillus sp. MBLB1832]WNR42842.1 helix-turn-helix domain-containing protein [Paenibacillus sp. MBLB1832]